MLSPENRVVMISGANRGIGLAVAKTLSAAGYRLSLGARDPSVLDLSMFSSEVFVQPYDALDDASASSWVQATQQKYSSIDALILNAGVMKPVAVASGGEQDLDLMWNVNFKAPLRLVRAALPGLKQCGHGRVINMVSLSGKRVMGSGNLGYCASKFAATSLTHALRYEGWDYGLRATSICPGLVDTDMVAQVTPPENEFKIDPEAIAETTAYALSLPNSASVAEILVNSRLETMF